MKTNTRLKVLEFIRKNSSVRPHDLIEHFGLTAAAIHRHLALLLKEKQIEKVGRPPQVFYKTVFEKSKIVSFDLEPENRKFIEEQYLYIDPSGNIKTGVEGFAYWLKSVKEERHANALAHEYIKIKKDAGNFSKNGLIDASKRFDGIFDEIFLDKVYYRDFYSLPKFGKTKLGQLVLHGKQAQDTKIIAQLANYIKDSLKVLILEEKINAVAWTPHSLPRKIPFLKELEKQLKLNLPKIELIKAYSGEVPVAQKTLSKLEDRITNARDTILVRSPQVNFSKVLLIDDAVGSGATLNEAAKKLKDRGAKKVIGFALVGSYKGFEVIKEV